MGNCVSPKTKPNKADQPRAPSTTDQTNKTKSADLASVEGTLPNFPVVYLESTLEGLEVQPYQISKWACASRCARISTHELLDSSTKALKQAASVPDPVQQSASDGDGDQQSQAGLIDVPKWSLDPVDPHAIRCVDGKCKLDVPQSGYSLQCAWVSQAGFSSDKSGCVSEDSFAVTDCVGGDQNKHLFSVFDGHGVCGAKISEHLRAAVRLAADTPDPASSSEESAAAVFARLSASLQRNIPAEALSSGSTGISVFVDHDVLTVANVGDSRAVLGTIEDGEIRAYDLSTDQTPYRADERRRLEQLNATVQSTGQALGERDAEIKSWEDDQMRADPPRVWYTDQNIQSLRGLAFTRSFGDVLAQQQCGITDEPEILQRQLSAADQIVLLASDGVFEHVSSQKCVELLHKYPNLQSGCHALVQLACREWMQKDGRSDDITIVAIRIEGLGEKRQSEFMSRRAPVDNTKAQVVVGEVSAAAG